jgi:hypothetical protein
MEPMRYGHAVTDGLMCNQRQIFVGHFDEIAGMKVLGFAKPVCSEPQGSNNFLARWRAWGTNFS